MADPLGFTPPADAAAARSNLSEASISDLGDVILVAARPSSIRLGAGETLRRWTSALDVAIPTIDQLTAVVDTALLTRDLDAVQKEMASSLEFQSMAIGGAVAMTTTLSAGYVIWILRGGYLLSSVLTSMPAWKLIDPLPILDCLDEDDRHDEQEEDDSLEALVDRAGVTGAALS